MHACYGVRELGTPSTRSPPAQLPFWDIIIAARILIFQSRDSIFFGTIQTKKLKAWSSIAFMAIRPAELLTMAQVPGANCCIVHALRRHPRVALHESCASEIGKCIRETVNLNFDKKRIGWDFRMCWFPEIVINLSLCLKIQLSLVQTQIENKLDSWIGHGKIVWSNYSIAFLFMCVRVPGSRLRIIFTC